MFKNKTSTKTKYTNITKQNPTSTQQKRKTDSKKKHNDHSVAMPAVSTVGRYRGTGPEKNQGRNSIRNHLGVGPVFCQPKSQSRAECCLGEDEHQEMIREMTYVQKEES